MSKYYHPRPKKCDLESGLRSIVRCDMLEDAKKIAQDLLPPASIKTAKICKGCASVFDDFKGVYCSEVCEAQYRIRRRGMAETVYKKRLDGCGYKRIADDLNITVPQCRALFSQAWRCIARR